MFREIWKNGKKIVVEVSSMLIADVSVVAKCCFGQNNFLKAFSEALGFKKPDYQKIIAEQAKAKTAMMEWQLTHPGQVPTKSQMDSMRNGKMPREK